MSDFLPLSLNSLFVPASFAVVYTNLDNITTIDADANGNAVLIFTNGVKRTSNTPYADMVNAIVNRYVQFNKH